MKGQSKSKEERRESRRTRLTRLVAVILALLMISGGLTTIIYYLITFASAADDVSLSQLNSEYTVAVGLMYGDGTTVGFETSTTAGYVVGEQTMAGERGFRPLWRLDAKTVSVTLDNNLSKSHMTYSVAGSSPVYVGGWHVELKEQFTYENTAGAQAFYASVAAALNNAGLMYDVFPVWRDGSLRIRVGCWISADGANGDVGIITAALAGVTSAGAEAVGPSSTAVSMVDPYTDTVLFEYDDPTGATALGLKAYSADGSAAYIKTPAANLYSGVFAYKPNAYGVALTNILPLEEYVAGVVPYEISNSWPVEVIKAFSITVRSYVISNKGRHMASYGFDVCNDQHCQVYKGQGRVNDSVRNAVAATAGKVLTYNGAICTTYYSSSTGGSTVNSGDAWGGANRPYLAAKLTPWEDYMNHYNGFWTVEVSPTELCAYLRGKGYDFYDAIASVTPVEIVDGSTYVYRLKITDIHGNSVTLKNTDVIRSTLGKYLNSANFVVGRGSVEYTEATIAKPAGSTTEPEEISEDKNYGYTDLSSYTVITADGVEVGSILGYVGAITGDGAIMYGRASVFAICADNAEAFENASTGAASIDTAAAETTAAETTAETYAPSDAPAAYTTGTAVKTAYASSADNFIFVGKGWGHGVGMSQYGAKDLAEQGYSYDYILKAYFNDTVITDYRSLS